MIAEATELDFVLRRLEDWVRRGGEGPDGGAVEPIRELHLELTHRCDLKCVMCHHWRMRSRELDAQALRGIVSGSRLLDRVETVVLSGGEPWLRTDIGEVAAALAERFPGASFAVMTNLRDTDRVRRGLEELLSRGVRRLRLGSSLDGLGRANDRVRGRAGAFEALLRSIRMLKREFPDVGLDLNFTLLPQNCAELLPAYQLARELGAGFVAQRVVEHEGFPAPRGLAWTPELVDAAEEQINGVLLDLCRREGAMGRILEGRERESRGLWTRLLYWHRLARYVRRPERFFKACPAGSRWAMLDPEGGLFFCPVNKHLKAGDARGAGFDAAWTSPAADRVRRIVGAGRCHCWLACTAYPALDRALEAGIG